MFTEALKKANSLCTDSLRASVLGVDVKAPQGSVTINKSCGHANVWSRVGRANSKGLFEVLFESKSAVCADPYLLGYGVNRGVYW